MVKGFKSACQKSKCQIIKNRGGNIMAVNIIIIYSFGDDNN